MKPFKTFITEEAASEPFHSIKEVPAKKDLVDLHIKLATAEPGCYGKSKIGSEIPDREMKHVQIKLGKQKFKGWGESFKSLEEADMPKATLKAHKEHIAHLNKRFGEEGHDPLQVKAVHILYGPRKTIVHLSNGTHEMGMSYTQGVSNGSGQRNFYATNGAKIPASKVHLVSLHTGEINNNETLERAQNLTISSTYDKSHDTANRLVTNGNDAVHQTIWKKFKETHDKGWNAGNGIPLNLLYHSQNPSLKQEIRTHLPHLVEWR